MLFCFVFKMDRWSSSSCNNNVVFLNYFESVALRMPSDHFFYAYIHLHGQRLLNLYRGSMISIGT